MFHFAQVKALYPGNSWVSRAANASLLAVPFKPFVVSSAHAAVLEYEYIRQARTNKVGGWVLPVPGCLWRIRGMLVSGWLAYSWLANGETLC